MHTILAQLIAAGNYMATSHHNTCRVVRNRMANDCDCGKEEWEQAMSELKEAIEERRTAEVASAVKGIASVEHTS